jgi:hypothetical protein
MSTGLTRLKMTRFLKKVLMRFIKKSQNRKNPSSAARAVTMLGGGPVLLQLHIHFLDGSGGIGMIGMSESFGDNSGFGVDCISCKQCDIFLLVP